MLLSTATIIGFLAAQNEAREMSDRRAGRAADRGAAALATEVERVILRFQAAGVLLDDAGAPGVDVFTPFARSLLRAGDIQGLLLVQEDATGVGRGFSVLASMPGGRSITAVELRADPIRRAAIEAALSSGEPAISATGPLVDHTGRGFTVAYPVSGSRPSVALVTGLPQEQIEALVRASVGTDEAVALVDDDQTVFGPTFGRRDRIATAEVDVGGRQWTVVVRSDDNADLTTALLLAAGGAAAILAMAALALVTRRNQRSLGRANDLLSTGEQRSLAVQDLAGRLAQALTGEDVITALVLHLPAAVGAGSAALATADDTGVLELAAPTGPGGRRGDAVALANASESELLASTILHHAPAWLSSPLAWRDDPAVMTLAAGGDALALLPLVANDVTGALAVSYRQVHIFGDQEKSLLQTVALLAGHALARGKEYDTQRKAALAFQREALPTELPDIDGLTVAARYRPAAVRDTVGGDWYDVLVIDERRVVLVVGDVVGHGILAAATMGRLRTAFQVIASMSTDPGAMVRAMSHQVDFIPNAFCTTMVCAVVDLDTGSMTWCRAGHLPPVAVGRAGATLLDGRGLAPLGVAPNADAPVHHHDLGAGGLVVLYTDGVIERRGESIDEGLRRITLVAENLGDLHPTAFADALIEALVPAADQHDDVAVLVVRYDGPVARD